MLRTSLSQWAEAFGRKLNVNTVEWWLRTFDKENPVVLAKAIELVTRTCERMPAPGTLTKAIADIRETTQCQPSTKYSYIKVVAKDEETGRMVDAIIYDNDPNTVCFRAADCKEGREFLALLAKWRSDGVPGSKLRTEREARLERNRQKVAYERHISGKERAAGTLELEREQK